MAQQPHQNKIDDLEFESRMNDIESKLETLNSDIMRERKRSKSEISNAIKTVSTVQGLPGAAGVDGSEGVNARGVNLTLTDQTIEFNTNGESPSPESVVATAGAVNYTGDVYYEFFLDDVSQENSTSATWEYDVSGLLYSDMPKKIECQIREDSPSGLILARDQITLSGLMAGSDAVTTILSNDAHTLPTTAAGVIDFTGSGTDIEVWIGTVQLEIGTGNMEYLVTATSTNITVGTPSTEDGQDGGEIRRFGDHSGSMPSNTDEISYAIAVKNEAGVTTNLTRKQTFSKSWEGQQGTALECAFSWQFGAAVDIDDHGSPGDIYGNYMDIADGFILHELTGETYTLNYDQSAGDDVLDSDMYFTAPVDGLYSFDADVQIVITATTLFSATYPMPLSVHCVWDKSTNGGTSWAWCAHSVAQVEKSYTSGTRQNASPWWSPRVSVPLYEDDMIRVRLCIYAAGMSGAYSSIISNGSEFRGFLIQEIVF